MRNLPDNYLLKLSVDLQNNKKQFWIVNILSFILIALLTILGCLFVPFSELFTLGSIQWIIIFLGLLVYIVLHELVHGIFMWYYSEEKPFFGFTGAYAYAGSHCYYNKKQYIVIALAPIVLLGIVLLILNIIFKQYFWAIYFIQIMNISGAAGDLYVSYLFSKLPEDILIKDIGVSMDVFSTK